MAALNVLDDTLLFFRKGVDAGVLDMTMPAMFSSTLGLEIVLNLRLTALQKFLIYWLVADVSLPNLAYRVLSTTTSTSGLTTEGQIFFVFGFQHFQSSLFQVSGSHWQDL